MAYHTRKQLESTGYKNVATVTNRTRSKICKQLGYSEEIGAVRFVATSQYNYDVFVKTEDPHFEHEIRQYNNK